MKLLQSLAGWTDWLNETSKAGECLQDGLRRCEGHVKSLPRVRYQFGPNRNSLRAARIFLQFLRERGLLPPGAEAPSADLRCALLGEFRTWMIEHHGVTEATLDVYQRALEDFVDAAGSEPRAYKPEVLHSFVLQRAVRHGASHTKLGLTALRSFLRFLGATGRCAPGLDHALPAYTSQNRSSTPRFLASEDVDRTIASCLTDGAGLRDRAIILLLARLGLRGGDIVRLRLSKIDWSNGRIAVCGKGRRHDFLPLPQEVGTAILDYLKQNRPNCRAAEVFVTVVPPFRKLSYQAVSGVVRRALVRAGVNSPVCGAHVLRHSAATTMLQQGVSLASIGSVLRHRSPRTTTHYAKVDITLLATIAQPWPGVA